LDIKDWIGLKPHYKVK